MQQDIADAMIFSEEIKGKIDQDKQNVQAKFSALSKIKVL